MRGSCPVQGTARKQSPAPLAPMENGSAKASTTVCRDWARQELSRTKYADQQEKLESGLTTAMLRGAPVLSSNVSFHGIADNPRRRDLLFFDHPQDHLRRNAHGLFSHIGSPSRHGARGSLLSHSASECIIVMWHINRTRRRSFRLTKWWQGQLTSAGITSSTPVSV